MSSPVEGMSVLVTGATGFIGRALCRALDAEGAIVHALSRGGQKPEGATDAWACDAADHPSLSRVVHAVRPGLVYHLAAQVTGTREVEAVLPIFHAKLTSCVNLLVATQDLAECRVVLAGSLEEPDIGTMGPLVSPYAAATSAATAFGEMFHSLYDRAIVTARIFMAYGPDDPNGDRLVPYVTRMLLRGESPELGSGMREVDWIYIDDLVRGLVTLGAPDGPVGGHVDLGSGRLVPIRSVVDRLVELVGSRIQPRFGARPDPAGERIRAADLASTRARIDWTPRVSLDEGLRRTVDSMRVS